MKSKLAQLFLLSWAVISIGSPAPQASGLRGGGETVVIDGRPRLRELVDRSSTCFWQPMTVLMQSAPLTEKILDTLRADHWYLARVYEREAESINVCFTANVISIPEGEWEGLTIGFYRRQQVAVRINDMVFLDQNIFAKMPEKDKALLLLHEITHSLIPLRAYDRGTKVRSITKLIGDHFESRLSKKVLQLNLAMNQVQVSSSFQELDENRQLIERLLDNSVAPALRLNAFAALGPSVINALLWYTDLNLIYDFTEPYYTAAAKAAVGSDEMSLRGLLNQGVSGVVPYFSGRSLLSIATERSTPRIIQLILEHANQSKSNWKNGSEELLIDIIDGRIKATELDSVIALNPNPNYLFVYRNRETRPEQWMTLLSFAMLKNRPDIADRLERSATVLPATYREAAVFAVGALSPEATRILLGWLDSGRIEVHSKLSRGLDLITESLEADNMPLFQELLARNASVEKLLFRAARRSDRNAFVEVLVRIASIDVNAKNAAGKSAFDLAMEEGNKAGASLIAKADRFLFDFNPSEAPRATHAKALVILETFCELNSVPSVEKLLKAYSFGFFDLFPHIERARMRGQTDLERTLKGAVRQ